jgi:hypothetical protein
MKLLNGRPALMAVLVVASMSGVEAESDTMAFMAGHMVMTDHRPAGGNDAAKARAVVERARVAMEPYKDYRKALANGYQIFLPNVPQPQYHFTKYEYGLEAREHFDPDKPTSLLYRKLSDGGYQLVGAMYTDRVDASVDELNERIPLSVARWHQHINFCKAPADRKAEYFGPEAKFGLRGSITPAASSTRTFLGGWCTCIPTKKTPPRSGRRAMTMRGMTTWITPRCRG